MTPDSGASYQSILLDLALLLSGRGKVTEVFESFAQRLLAVTRFEYTALVIAESDPRYFRVAGRYPSWEGSIPAGAILGVAEVPPSWRHAGLNGIEYTPGPDDPEASRRQFNRGFRHCWAAGLSVDGALYGVLTVARRSPDLVTKDELAFLRSAAQLLAAALRQDRLLAESDQAAAQNHVLNELALLLHAGEPLAALFDRMPPLVARAIQVDYISAWTTTDDGRYRMVAAYPALASDGEVYSTDPSHADRIFAAPGHILEYRADQEPGHWPERYTAAGMTSVLAAGMDAKDGRLGFIGIGRAADYAFTPGERRFVASLAAMIGQAEANQRRLDQLAAASARARVLNEMTLVLNTGEAVEGLFHRLIPLLERAIEFDYVSLLVATETPGELRQVGSRPQLLRKPGDIVDGEALRLEAIAAAPGLVQFELNASTVDSGSPLFQAGLKCGASIALRDGKQPLGLLTIARRRQAPCTPAEVEFVEVLATIIGQAVANQRRLQRIATEAARAGVLNDLTILLNAGEPVGAMFDRLLVLLEQAVEFDYVGLLVSADAPGALRQVGSRPELLRPAGVVVDCEAVGGTPISATKGVVQVDLGRLETGGPEYSAILLREGIVREASIALRDGDETVGIFSVCRRRDAPYLPEDLEFIETLATILGQAVAGQRRLEASRTEASRSMLLNQVALLVNSGEPPKGYLDRLGELLQSAIGFGHMAVLLPEGDGARLRVEASLRSRVLQVGQSFQTDSLLSRLGEHNDRLVNQYLTEDIGAELASAAASHGIARLATSVLRDGDALLGVIMIGREPDLPFLSEEMDLLELVCTLVGYALADDRRLRLSRSEAARSKLLSELGMRLNAGEPTGAMFKVVVGLLRPIVAWDRASLLIAMDDSTKVRVAASIPGVFLREGDEYPLAALPVAPEHMLATSSWRYSLGELSADLTRGSDPAPDGWGISATLHERDQFLGMVTLWREADESFTDEEADLVEFLATLLAQSVAGEQRMRKAQAEAARQRLLNELAILLNAGEGVESLFDLLPPLLTSAVDCDYVGIAFEAGRPGYLRAADWNARFPAPAKPTWLRQEDAGMEHFRRTGDRVVCYAFQPGAEKPGSLVAGFAENGLKHSVFARLGSAADPLGLLHIGRASDETFTPVDVDFVEVVATIFTQALTNQVRVLAAGAEADEQRLVAAVASAAAAEPDPGALVAAVIEPLRALIPRPFLAFGYLDGDEVVYPRPNGEDVRLPFEHYQRRALLEGQIHADSLPHDIRSTSLRLGMEIKANAITLAHSGGVPIGLLATGSGQDGYAFGERELRLFRLIAQIIGPAMENARTAQRQRRDAEEQRVLAEVAAIAARENEPVAILEQVAARLQDIVPMALVAYGHISWSRISFSISATDDVTLPMSVAELEASTGLQVLGDSSGLDASHPAHRWDLKQVTLTPVWSGGVVTGLLNVGSRERDFEFRTPELRFLREVAIVVGPAIETARASANIARQRALYDLILRSLTEGVILLDRNAKVVFANAQGRLLVDAVDPDKVAGGELANIASLLPPELAGQWMQAIRSGEGVTGRASIVRGDGPWWLDYEIVSLDDPEFRLLIVVSDATDAVRREEENEQHRQQMQQASRLAALGELISGVAHELNNPLTAVLGFAEVLAQSPAAESFREEVSIIQTEALRARNIVRDLLFIARPGPVERAPVAMGSVVAHVERLRRTAWTRAGATVTLDVPAEGSIVWGNEHQLTQVLLNLVTNAEFAVAGLAERELSISVVSSGETVELIVSDTGAGMSPEIAERIFEPFFTTKQGAGTGLGLSLSYSIVQSHFGRIEVDSQPGVGTRFRVILPAHTGVAVAVPPVPSPVKARVARVLVVDDEPSLRKVCQRLIESMGHECAVAGTSAEALALAANHEFDLVLCDYRLAYETADDVIAALSRTAPHLIPRTVIATGATTDSGVVRLTERHGLGLIAKPYGANELADVISEALRDLPLRT